MELLNMEPVKDIWGIFEVWVENLDDIFEVRLSSFEVSWQYTSNGMKFMLVIIYDKT